MADDQLYAQAIEVIDENMNDLRKKRLRDMLIYKTEQVLQNDL